MLPVNLFDLNAASESELTRVVVVSSYNGKWIFCKHKERETWEIPGGHIEPGENWLDAAKRELYEETGAYANIEPICLYKISTYGLLCYADVKQIDKLPKKFEMERIGFFDDLPEQLTYEDAHTKFFNKVKKTKNL